MRINIPILTTDRLSLLPIVASDIEHVYKGLSHPDVIKYYGVSYTSLEATKEQMEWFAELEKSGTGLWWKVCSRKDGKFLGAGGLNDINQEHNKAEIGFWLLPEYWSKGIMTEAMPKILEFAFDTLGLNRIEGFVDPENIGCKKSLAKLDFSLEGTMRACEFQNGQYLSIDIYSRLASD